MKRGILVLTLNFLILAACTEPIAETSDLEVGEAFSNSDVRIMVLDTFTISMRTIKFDSIITSDSERLLLGRYEDDLFGTVAASNFFELSAINYSLPNNAELDSVALILGYDHYFYSDTTRLAQINVHLLSDELRADDENFYNTSMIDFDSIPLVSKTYRPEPIDEDSVHISIPDQFGEELFGLIQEKEINSNDDLREFLKGISLQPGVADQASVIGFTQDETRTYLRFFYSIPNEFEDDQDTFDLVINPFTTESIAFNRIVSDVAGTPLGAISDQEDDLSTLASNNIGYIQAGSGYAIKIEFPHIRTLYDIAGTGTVLSATLSLKPPRESYNDLLPLRDSLEVNVIDQNNEISRELRTGQGLVIGELTGENEEFEEIIYEIPVGIFVEEKLTEVPITEDALLLTSVGYNDTVNRLVLEDQDSADFEARLTITYAIYDE